MFTNNCQIEQQLEKGIVVNPTKYFTVYPPFDNIFQNNITNNKRNCCSFEFKIREVNQMIVKKCKYCGTTENLYSFIRKEKFCISNLCNSCKSTILKLSDDNRKLYKNILTKQILENLYYNQKLSIYNISIQFNIPESFIKTLLKKYNIKTIPRCKYCNTENNLRKEKSGKIYNVCNKCYADNKRKLWFSKSEDERNIINKKSGQNAYKAKLNNIDEDGLNGCERGSIKSKLTWENKTKEEIQEIRKKYKKTCLEKYGVDNVFKFEEIKDKIKDIRLKDIDENGLNSFNRVPIKANKTKLNRYGRYFDPLKMKETKLNNIDKNGLNSYQRQVIKLRETKSKKDENGLTGYERQVITMKNTNLERYGSSNPNLFYSKISQELFWEIYNNLNIKFQNHTHFATLNGEFGRQDIITNKYYYFDFVISSIKFCIEFNGDVFHANPKLYKETDCPNFFCKEKQSKEIWEFDRYKNNILEKEGYKIFIVWESDYKKDKENVIKNILKELNKNVEVILPKCQ